MPSLGRTSGGLFADFDGDGDDDLLLIRHAGLSGQSDVPSRIYENDGSGELAISEILPIGFLGRTPAVADFDGDGLLDIYVSEDKHGDSGGILLHNQGGNEVRRCDQRIRLSRGYSRLGPPQQISTTTPSPTWSPRGTSSSIRMTLTFLDVTPVWFVAEQMGW